MENLVRSILKPLGCCQNCLNRFAGVRTWVKGTLGNCIACLGILELDYHQIALDALLEYKRRTFQLSSNTFGISAQLPVQLIVRQRSLELLLAERIANYANPVQVKEAFKSLLSAAFSECSNMTYEPVSPLALNLKFTHTATELEFQFMTNIPHAKFTVHQKRRRVGDGSRQTVHEGAATDKVASAVSKLSYQDFVEHQMCPPGAITTIAVASNVTFEHSALFVAGRYCKLMRGISNSIWIIGGKKITEDSIEELVGNPLLEFFGATSMKFCSAGREDADVLMLGTGRPFYFEIINPTRGFATMEEMNLLQEQIIERAKNKVGLLDLQIVPRDTIAVLKQSANTKKKSYQCLVQLSEPASPNDIEIINQMKDIEVSQKNPTRIPRRADLTRSKIVHEINVRISPSQANELIVDLTTSAGTYVKEFMHSDGDRTVPSLKSLLNVTNVTVVSLDVLQVHLDWPPALNKA